ncbi:PPOX class F420-dependent oxidoreductase [Actinocrinis puniceicyclus]|uniref:PPOX class F420-dependent oxidoreductase n=1 Tax=Actinocrinis puniceicyclus TaxID=977794 RepID=A0A8J7WTG5_9ACTN|nr:PPOX class F420-dependent oxidoreductase [Actinocrinis puniceicyclus]MBS2966162.1 PPOX class F420-dependent oxidoreductase [Actinocrinis puniceicyclus]
MATMTKEQALDFLTAGTRTGKLATASSVGAPHVAPVWFVLDGDDLVFTTAETSVKGRHLRANPRAALTVDSDEYPYHFVAVRGAVTLLVDPDDLVAWAAKIAERYVPAGRAEEYGRRNAVPGELLCRLRIERVTGVSDIAL